MFVLVADGILIVMLIIIGKLTELLALTASKRMSTVSKIKEGKPGMIEINNQAIQRTGNHHMSDTTHTLAAVTRSVKEMTSSGNMIVATKETDINIL